MRDDIPTKRWHIHLRPKAAPARLNAFWLAGVALCCWGKSGFFINGKDSKYYNRIALKRLLLCHSSLFIRVLSLLIGSTKKSLTNNKNRKTMLTIRGGHGHLRSWWSIGASYSQGLVRYSNQYIKEHGMKMQEVREKAKILGLKNTFGLSKAELTRMVQRAEGNFDCFGMAMYFWINLNVASGKII